MGKKKNRRRELTAQEQLELILNDTTVLPEEEISIKINSAIERVCENYTVGFMPDTIEGPNYLTKIIPEPSIVDEESLASIKFMNTPIKITRTTDGTHGIKLINYSDVSVTVPVIPMTNIAHDGDYDTMEVGLNLAISTVCRAFVPRYVLNIKELEEHLPKYKAINNVVFTRLTSDYVGVHLLTDELDNLWENFEDYSDGSITLYTIISNMLTIGLNSHKCILTEPVAYDSIEKFIDEMDYVESAVEENHGLELLHMKPEMMLSKVNGIIEAIIEDLYVAEYEAEPDACESDKYELPDESVEDDYRLYTTDIDEDAISDDHYNKDDDDYYDMYPDESEQPDILDIDIPDNTIPECGYVEIDTDEVGSIDLMGGEDSIIYPKL